MATVYKVLGQNAPSATTATTLYTVPASTSTVVSTITVCNINASAITYRISVRPAAAVQTNAMYIAYDVSLPANATDTLTLGLTLDSWTNPCYHRCDHSLCFNNGSRV